MYNPKSLKAEEFIDHQEILDTLAYADENKNNVELIDQILNKARERKGLSHREASVLLACDIPEKVQELYALAEHIKKDFYGNRIVIFAPLYLSNYCVNGCLYCPYHQKNKHIPRKKLTQEEASLWISHSDRFHLIFYDYCHNTRLAVAAGRLRSQLTIFSNAYETGSLPQATIFRAHEEIFSLYKERHFQEAADRMRLHLEESLQFALEALDSMAE